MLVLTIRFGNIIWIGICLGKIKCCYPAKCQKLLKTFSKLHGKFHWTEKLQNINLNTFGFVFGVQITLVSRREWQTKLSHCLGSQ